MFEHLKVDNQKPTVRKWHGHEFNTDIKARTSLIRVQHDTNEMQPWSSKTRKKILAK